MRSPSVSIGSVCVLFFVCHVGVQSIAADESDDGAICVSNRNRNRFLSLSLSLSFSLGIFFSADVIRKTSAIFNSVRRRCQADAGPGAYITAAIVIGCGQKCRFSFVFHIRFVFYFGIFTVARRGDDEKRWPPATTGGPVYRVFLPSFRFRRSAPQNHSGPENRNMVKRETISIKTTTLTTLSRLTEFYLVLPSFT